MARTRGAPGQAGSESKYNVRAIERALTVLNSFSREHNKLSLDEVTRRTGLSKPTAFRILSTLQAHGYLIADPADGKYRLGSVFLALAGAAIGSMSLRRVARPHLDALRDRLQVTVLLGALMDGNLVYLDKRESYGPVRIATDIGWRGDPPHFGMLGMTLLAYQDDAEVTRILRDAPLTAFTPHSITDPEAFRTRLERIRRQGYAVEFNEAIEGVWGVAAPVWDATEEVVAAVGVALPVTASSDERLAATVAAVRECAQVVSDDLGYRPPEVRIPAAR